VSNDAMTAIMSDEVATTAPVASNKIHIWLMLFGVALFSVGFLLTFERGSAYLAWSAGCVVFNILTVCRLFAHRTFLFSTLSLFLTYGMTIVWVANYVMEMPMSSWRMGWESGHWFPEALGMSIQFLTFFNILSTVAITFVPAHRMGRPLSPVGNGYHLPVLLLAGASGLPLIVIAGTQARDDYLVSADIESMFLVQAASIMLAALFAFNLFFMPRGAYRNAINVILVGVTLIVGMNGFRFLLVIFAFICFFYILATQKFSKRRILALSVGAVVGYLFLLVLAYTRSVGMTFGEALAFLVHPDLDAAYGYAGASDQTNLIAQNYYYSYYYEEGGGHLLHGRTYFDAFLRLPPHIVHTTYFDTLRSQDYIIQTGSFVPDVFRKRNWTIGAPLVVEAIINFGRVGPYIVLSVFVLALTGLEKVARKSYTLFLGYVVTASMGFDLAWYGFGNWLKEGVFAFTCGAVIIWTGRLTARHDNARPKFRSDRSPTNSDRSHRTPLTPSSDMPCD
jgi:hypothetical protein